MNKRTLFLDELAQFLVGNQAGKSIALELESRRAPIIPWATEWASLRRATPLFGYPTVEEARRVLVSFLGWGTGDELVRDEEK